MQKLISEDDIQTAVAELGARISVAYRGRPLTVLGVLTGSLVLLADLIRRIEIPHRVGVLQASSYRGGATQPGELLINPAFAPDLSGRDVLMVDDIYDTGRTLERLLAHLRGQQPASVRSAVLLWKEGRQQVAVTPDDYCFRIPDVFVVGYGLDYNDDYRHLPFIGALEGSESPLPR